MSAHVQRAQNELFWRGFRRSAAAHGGLIILAILAGLTLRRDPIRINPSIRVDLVALPDITKKNMKDLTPDDMTDLKDRLNDATKDTRKAVEKMKKEAAEKPAEPDTMALKKEKPKKSKRADLKNAIDRIKALTEIENEVKKSQKQKVVIKGNALAKGNALSGDPSSDTNAYVGQLQSKLRDNWNLPVWLSKQNLDAKVLLFLDKAGYVNKSIISKSSGDQQFDDYVLKTVRISQPFGVPPDELVNAGITLGFPL